MPESWTIGSAPGCDIVVAQPVVSGRHCRLTRDTDGFTLEDLRSTNGTFVNGTRLSGTARVQRTDTITLGLSLPLPWPELPPETAVQSSGTRIESALRTLRIGREPDNDIAIANPIVSSRHARLIWDGVSDHAIVEDLGSSNGTAIGSPANKIRKAPIRSGDTLYLGSLAIPAATLLIRFSPSLVETSTSGETIPRRGLSAGVRLGILVGQVPILAGVILAIGSARWPLQLSWLGLAAIWFGLMNAILLDPEGDRASLGHLGLRLGLGFGLAVGQCLGLWLIVSGGAGLHGSGTLLALMILGSATGLALGAMGASFGLGPNWLMAAAPGVLVVLALLGGQILPVATAPAAMKPALQLSPSRWVFEGMLLAGSSASPDSASLVDNYFPAETDRMGPRAAVLALVAMIVGLSGAATYLTASASRPEMRPTTP